MPSAYFYSCFLVAVWIIFIKAQTLGKFPTVKTSSDKSFDVTDSTNGNIHNGISKDTSETEVEDVYDDYMKIVIYEGLQFRTAVGNTDKIWEDGIVPYVISDDYSKVNKDFILESVAEFHNKTCVQFRQRENETSYIMLVPGSGCSAVIGKITNNTNRINLHENCFVKGIILHELMHALGFIHEQNRPDRDEFVKIDFDNIRNGSERNFDKYSESELHLFNQTYDYESVMHYGTYDFAVDKDKPTILPLKKDVEIGQRKGFSEKDLIKINLLYNCNETKAAANRMENKKAEDMKKARLGAYHGKDDDDVEEDDTSTEDSKENINKNIKKLWRYVQKILKVRFI